jgi:hypothetical protein
MCVCSRARVCVHKRAYTDTLHIQRWRPNGWTDRDPNWYKHSLGQSAQVMGVGEHVTHAARNRGGAGVPRVNECEAREYMNKTWRHSRREREARVCGPLKNTIAESQTDSSRYQAACACENGHVKKQAIYWQMLVYIFISFVK